VAAARGPAKMGQRFSSPTPDNSRCKAYAAELVLGVDGEAFKKAAAIKQNNLNVRTRASRAFTMQLLLHCRRERLRANLLDQVIA
jgi:hypothetical protein